MDDRTVAMSMRETENEINLLVPADLRAPTYGEPEWTFAAPSDDGGGDDDAHPEGDELGDTVLDGGRR